MQRLEIPVLCLRWSQASINRKMVFGDGESIFKLVDQLERGDKTPGDINKHLNVVQYQGHFVSLSNRRLAALMMYQSLHRDRIVKAWCRICSSDTEEFETKYKTANHGLGVNVCDGDQAEGPSRIYPKDATSIWPKEQHIRLWPGDCKKAAKSTTETDVGRGRNLLVLGVYGDKLDISFDPLDMRVVCEKAL